VGSFFRGPEVGPEQIPFPRYYPRMYTPGKMEGRPPICRYLRNAELPGQTLRVCRQVLAGVAFTDVGGRPAIARGTFCQKGYELLVVRGATSDHLVGQVGSADGIHQNFGIAFSGLADERHLVRLGDGEV
jgi:hypothetical protein